MGHTISRPLFRSLLSAIGVSGLIVGLLFFVKPKEDASLMKRTRLIMLATPLLGGLLAKLGCPAISKTHACALSILSFFSSNIIASILINMAQEKNLSSINAVYALSQEYLQALGLKG